MPPPQARASWSGAAIRRRDSGAGGRYPSELCGRTVFVRTDGVGDPPPTLDHHLCLQQGVEHLPGKQLVSKLAVETLHVAVLPKRADIADLTAVAAARTVKTPSRAAA